MEPERITSFPPIVDEASRVLVLGTMPGAESLRQRRYYAYDRNHFWAVVFALYGLPRPNDYDKRIAFLHDKHIALWDVLESCERQTSADSEIKNAVPNPIPELLRDHPAIRVVLTNGKGAEKLFKRFIQPNLVRPVEMVVLPSTSPAYASLTFGQKLAGWQKLLGFLS